MNVEETVDWFLDVFKTLAYKIHNELNPRAVLDLGSGSGMLTYFLRQADPRRLTVTVDANQSVQANGKYTDSNHFWARTDKELNFVDEYGNKIYFDLVTSLEHFEHISQKTFDKLMENVLNHTKKGANLLATAALWPTEGQYEHVHCNVKKSGQDWYDYLLTKGFARANFSFPIGRAGESVQIFCTRQ
jgi:cyclopropane fatty-acyl-phospholipid synthase-like methyltransferase